MATPAEIAAKHEEFQGAVAELSVANTDYEEKKAPYLAAKEVLIASIAKVDALDNELETMTKDYEPQSNPDPQ